MARNQIREADAPLQRRTATVASQSLWDDQWIAQQLERVRETISNAVGSVDGAVGEGLREFVSRPGKLLRPGLVIVGASVGGKPRITDRIISLASAVELLHLATLIHDDIVDAADTRRGGAALHTTYGTRVAVLMGDTLFARCFRIVSDSASMRNARYLAEIVGHICGGEVAEFDQNGRPIASVRAYKRRVVGKTALLIALSLFVGASERRRERSVQSRLLRVGYNLGMAFQIVDDILDYSSDEAHLGKPVGTDLQAGIHTLPAILALRSRPEIAPLLTPPVEQIDTAVRAVDDAGGIAAARSVASEYTKRAFGEIDKLPKSVATESLARAATLLLSRDR